ncbi:MAG: cytochrome c peroxidase [Oceanospirillaceae bacterium]
MRKKIVLTTLFSSCFLLSSNAIAQDMLAVVEIDAKKAELGKRLFFDTRLSGDAAISCASCHEPNNGFASSTALSPGYPGNGHFRNAPSLINTIYKKSWFHDGRIGTNLNDVTRSMITEDYSMNMDMRLMQERLKQDPIYVKMFKDAGYGEPSNGGVRKAIPEFLKTLTSKNAPIDTNQLSASAKRGEKLFKGKGSCAQCHTGPLFSDGKAHNTGVAENFDIFLKPSNHQAFIAFNMFMGNENYMALKRDVGAHVQTHKADGTDIGKFMTPSLRELKYTAPYMHNGMIKTLPEVVAFYNAGGGQDKNRSVLLKKLKLSAQEQKDLVSYLQGLSGDALVSDTYIWNKEDYSYQVINNWLDVKN